MMEEAQIEQGCIQSIKDIRQSLSDLEYQGLLVHLRSENVLQLFQKIMLKYLLNKDEINEYVSKQKTFLKRMQTNRGNMKKPISGA